MGVGVVWVLQLKAGQLRWTIARELLGNLWPHGLGQESQIVMLGVNSPNKMQGTNKVKWSHGLHIITGAWRSISERCQVEVGELGSWIHKCQKKWQRLLGRGPFDAVHEATRGPSSSKSSSTQ